VQEGDERVVKAVEELKKAGIKILKDEEWEIEDRIVIKEEKIYVPEGEHHIRQRSAVYSGNDERAE